MPPIRVSPYASDGPESRLGVVNWSLPWNLISDNRIQCVEYPNNSFLVTVKVHIVNLVLDHGLYNLFNIMHTHTLKGFSLYIHTYIDGSYTMCHSMHTHIHTHIHMDVCTKRILSKSLKSLCPRLPAGSTQLTLQTKISVNRKTVVNWDRQFTTENLWSCSPPPSTTFSTVSTTLFDFVTPLRSGGQTVIYKLRQYLPYVQIRSLNSLMLTLPSKLSIVFLVDSGSLFGDNYKTRHSKLRTRIYPHLFIYQDTKKTEKRFFFFF